MIEVPTTEEEFAKGYPVDKVLLEEGPIRVCEVHDSEGKHFISITPIDNPFLAEHTDAIKFYYSEECLGNNPYVAHLLRIVHDTNDANDTFLVNPDACTNGMLMYYMVDQKLSPNELQSVFIKLANLISAAHKKNIVLRNISISNVGLDSDKNPVLLSLVTSCENGDKVPIFDRSPHMCPPETVPREKGPVQEEPRIEAKFEQDIYVFGALMHMLLGGRFAPVGFSLRVGLSTHFYPVPSENLNQSMKDFIKKMMGPPDQRPTIEQVVEALTNGIALVDGADIAK